MFQQGWKKRRDAARARAARCAVDRNSPVKQLNREMAARDDIERYFNKEKAYHSKLIAELDFSRAELTRINSPDYLSANADEQRLLLTTRIATLPDRIAAAATKLKPVAAEHKKWMAESDARVAELNRQIEAEMAQEK